MLARLLKTDRRYAVGLLHDLFSWAIDAARKDGALPGLTGEDIAAALDFSGKKGSSVVSALLDSGYLEYDGRDFFVHDWYDYAGKLADKRDADKARQAASRQRRKDVMSQENPCDVRVTSVGNPIVTVPNSTVPDNHVDDAVSAHARTRERDDPALGRIIRAYEARITAMPISSVVLEGLRGYVGTLDEDVILDAFEAALAEGKREWSYVNGILKHRKEAGITTMLKVAEERERRAQRREMKQDTPRGQRSPRPYGGEPKTEEQKQAEAAANETAMSQLSRLREKMTAGGSGNG